MATILPLAVQALPLVVQGIKDSIELYQMLMSDRSTPEAVKRAFSEMTDALEQIRDSVNDAADRIAAGGPTSE
jgi:uncharacterized protein (UPF0147 family)